MAFGIVRASVAAIVAVIAAIVTGSVTTVAATALRPPWAAFVIVAMVMVVFAPGLMASATGPARSATRRVTSVAVLCGRGVDHDRPGDHAARTNDETADRRR